MENEALERKGVRSGSQRQKDTTSDYRAHANLAGRLQDENGEHTGASPPSQAPSAAGLQAFLGPCDRRGGNSERLLLRPNRNTGSGRSLGAPGHTVGQEVDFLLLDSLGQEAKTSE